MKFRRPVVAYAVPEALRWNANDFLWFLEQAGEDCQPHQVIEKLQEQGSVAVTALKTALVVESTDEIFAGMFVGQLVNILSDSVKSCPRHEFYLGSLLGLLRLAGSSYNTGDAPEGFHQTWGANFTRIISRGGAFTVSSQTYSLTGENEKEYKEAALDWLKQHGPDQVVAFLDTEGNIRPQSYGKAVFDLIFYVWVSGLGTTQRAVIMKGQLATAQTI